MKPGPRTLKYIMSFFLSLKKRIKTIKELIASSQTTFPSKKEKLPYHPSSLNIKALTLLHQVHVILYIEFLFLEFFTLSLSLNKLPPISFALLQGGKKRRDRDGFVCVKKMMMKRMIWFVLL